MKPPTARITSRAGRRSVGTTLVAATGTFGYLLNDAMISIQANTNGRVASLFGTAVMLITTHLLPSLRQLGERLEGHPDTADLDTWHNDVA